MRTLSVMQPWSWLLTNIDPKTGKAFKQVENRDWRYDPKPAMYGPLLVHAGKKIDRDGYNWVRETYPDIPLPGLKELETGGIVGLTIFTDCVRGCAGDLPDPFFFGPLGLIMKEGRGLKFFECKGQLGFFDVTYPHPLSMESVKIWELWAKS
ncbi:MAG TPA: hypothetical protein DCS05_12590 [Nitrospiraceae bacterium]|nr:hypothetical protein [Nitrospiraceae bacterium]